MVSSLDTVELDTPANSRTHQPSNLRRLAADHAALHSSPLPPNYLFPSSSSSDDLTSLTLLLAGPTGTPYSHGLFRLHLRIPATYPTSPPTATFHTRIWHPNVDEATGAVCVDTLKRDWEEKLTLRHVLVTISCLLVCPNPESALNGEAGRLMREDWTMFERRARDMTGIHARVPLEMRGVVREARRRGEEDPGVGSAEEGEEEDERTVSLVTRRKPENKGSTVVMKEKALPLKQTQPVDSDADANADADDEDEDESSTKENEFPTEPIASPRKPTSPSVLGKRPLSVLATESETEPDLILIDDNEADDNERNIAANIPPQNQSSNRESVGQPLRKSPKLSLEPSQQPRRRRPEFDMSRLVTSEEVRARKCTSTFTTATVDECDTAAEGKGKENAVTSSTTEKTQTQTQAQSTTPSASPPPVVRPKDNPLPSNTSINISTTTIKKRTVPSGPLKPALKPKPKPRVGLRRL